MTDPAQAAAERIAVDGNSVYVHGSGWCDADAVAAIIREHYAPVIAELVEALERIRNDDSLHVDWSDDEYTPDSIRNAIAVLAKHRP